MRAPRARAHQRRTRDRGWGVFFACDQAFHVAWGAMLRYCGIMAPIVEGAVTRARDSARPAAGFPRRHALGVSGNAVHGRSCPLWAAALPWLPLQYRKGSLDWHCAVFDDDATRRGAAGRRSVRDAQQIEIIRQGM